MASLGLRPPAILVRLRAGIHVELRILVAAGVPVAEVARQVDSAVRYSVRRAIGREMVLSSEHDGRIIADVVTDWARRHGQPFTLTLSGPAGAVYTAGENGPDIDLDAVEFCRILSGRANGSGLLAVRVVF